MLESNNTFYTFMHLTISICYSYSILAKLHWIGLNWSSFQQYTGIEKRFWIIYITYLFPPLTPYLDPLLYSASQRRSGPKHCKRGTNTDLMNRLTNMNARWRQLPVRTYLQVCIRAWTLRKKPTSFLSFRYSSIFCKQITNAVTSQH